MSHIIRPDLIPSYIDDEMHQSAQGAFQGSDYWDAERQCDKALERERKKRQQWAWLKEELHRKEEELAIAEQRGFVRKADRLKDQIYNIKEQLKQIRL